VTSSNAEWQERKLAAIARGQGNIAPVYIERGENAELWDVEGNRYIDFGTGIAVCNTGHSNPRVVAAVKDQVERFSHTCVMVTPYDSAVQLAEQLNELAPGDSPKKSIFVTTGAEAVENTIKIARAYTGRRGVIAFNGGFHGRTMLAMGLTGKITPYKNLFGPFPGEVYHAPSGRGLSRAVPDRLSRRQRRRLHQGIEKLVQSRHRAVRRSCNHRRTSAG
jgi:4-aminobutyrate aminotransferase/(S)-3-amino-2-methylpropionate transaminase